MVVCGSLGERWKIYLVILECVNYDNSGGVTIILPMCVIPVLSNNTNETRSTDIIESGIPQISVDITFV